MQALAMKSTRAAPFTNVSSKKCAPICRIPAIQSRSQRHVLAAPKAAAAGALSDFVDAEDLTTYLASETTSNFASAPADSVKLRIRMRGYDIKLLQEACNQITAVAEATGAALAGPVMLPTRRRLYCVLRSPHVNKDSREHFEVRTHHRLIDLKNLSVETISAMMEWVPPAGVEAQCSII